VGFLNHLKNLGEGSGMTGSLTGKLF
jgi:hypothetical protein